jgi:hypothetical protein
MAETASTENILVTCVASGERGADVEPADTVPDARVTDADAHHDLPCLPGVGLSARYSVDRATPTTCAISPTVLSLVSYSCRATASFAGVSFGLRPPLRPRARAAARPALSRSQMMSRSASAAKMWNITVVDVPLSVTRPWPPVG